MKSMQRFGMLIIRLVLLEELFEDGNDLSMGWDI